MLLQISDFKEGEIVDVQQEYDPKKLGLEFVDLKYQEPLHLDGSVERGSETLIFKGQLQSKVERACGRCLTTRREEVNKPFELYYDIQGKDTIDALDDLREVLLLNHTIAYVCREDCKGLCPTCGINLNQETCSCEQKLDSKAFSTLKAMWPKKKKEENNHGAS